MSSNKITAIKVKIKNGVATTKMAFSHPMMTYNQAKTKTGNSDDANFITHITGSVGSETVLGISTSQFFSKNPIFKFQFQGIGAKGDKVLMTWTDRKGNTGKGKGKIK